MKQVTQRSGQRSFGRRYLPPPLLFWSPRNAIGISMVGGLPATRGPQPLPTPSWLHPSLVSDLGSELVLWEDRLSSRTSPSKGWTPFFCGLSNALGSSQRHCVCTYRKTVGVFPPHRPLHFQRPQVSQPLYKVVFPLLTGHPLAKPPVSMRSACALEKHLQTLSPLCSLLCRLPGVLLALMT